MTASIRLDAESLVVAHDGVPRLHGVSLHLTGGRMLAVTGSAGAGKTTLLWALAGQLPLAAGSLALAAPGRRRSTRAPRTVLMPQGNGLAATLSAYENVLIPLLANGITPVKARAITFDALTSVGLDEAGGQLIEELSGGQQQRVCVARGLAAGGDVVLADEPTSAVDAANRAIIMRLLRREADRGAVVIVATHDDEAADECDAQLHLVDGSVSDDTADRIEET